MVILSCLFDNLAKTAFHFSSKKYSSHALKETMTKVALEDLKWNYTTGAVLLVTNPKGLTRQLSQVILASALFTTSILTVYSPSEVPKCITIQSYLPRLNTKCLILELYKLTH